MSFDNTKYDVEINTVPYRIKGYQKSELNTFIPRVGGGEQKESNFDLLRAKTLQSVAGGIMQRFWEDDTSVFGCEGMFPVYDDGVVYPVNDIVSTANIIGKDVVTAWCRSGNYLFYAKISYSSPTTTLYRIDTAGTRTAMTLPAAISSRTIASLVVWNGVLMVSTTDGAKLGQMNIQSTTTVTEVTTSLSIYLMAIFNGSLYYTNADGNAHNSVISRYTGTTATAAGVEVARVPSYITTYAEANSGSARFFIYNNRLMLTRTDGLWAYDGVRLVAIDDFINRENTNNFRLATVLKGYLYYFMPDGMYRFNGSLIEKLYDAAEVGQPVDMCEGDGRLWIMYRNSAFAVSSRYDKAMGYDYTGTDSIEGRIFCFDGKAMYCYGRTATFVKNPATIDFSGQSELHRLMYYNRKLYATQLYDKFDNGAYTVATDETTNTGNKSWLLTSSIFDGDFPMIDKSLENLEVVLDGNIVSDQSITIEYRLLGFDGSTGWTSLGTLLTQSDKKEYVFSNTPAGITFQNIQFRLSGTTDARYGIKKVVLRYLLAPDFKWQWQFTALCYGDVDLEPLNLADNTQGSQAVNTLRDNIYAARHSDIPIRFVDVDQLDLNEALDSSETAVTLNSTKMLKGANGFILIDDEIMYWTAKTATDLTVVRGALGTSAAAHNDNSKVFIVYRAIIRQIQNERIELSDRDSDTTEDKSRQSEITLLMQEV